MKTKSDTAYLYHLIELEGDLYTPIQIFQILSGTKKFILESSAKHKESGRYSFIGRNPFGEIKGTGPDTIISFLDSTQHKQGGQLTTLFDTIKTFEDLSLPFPFPFAGGGIGYIGYDVIRQIEKIGKVPEDSLQMPDVHFMLYDQLVVFDHIEEKLSLLSLNLGHQLSQDELKNKNQELKKEIEAGVYQREEDTLARQNLSFNSNIEKEKFKENVVKAKEYITAGDIFQVVISQRLEAKFTGNPFLYYRKLRKENPSPYMYFIDFSDYVVLGTSPESLVKAHGEGLTTNPIAGTRKRGATAEEDENLQKELLSDEKELAEHNMLVDLSRNDLGRVCKTGSIGLTKYLQVERYKFVMHLVSEVKGIRRKAVNNDEVLAACLPAGTVSGAPKIRAMQIINELEQSKRGLYSGAVGYIGFNGDFDLALAIRTMIVKEEKAYVQAGAGIVYDSDPETEYEETMNKAKALLEVKQ
ncbi:anthranilate synthase component I [Bacillus sp. 2205SS5-2]|uniref:anthranilate synthase component I n=1 Tax=Bacillus sp. 2205SS5-2 TaxID=3109031 RepID=UPI0030074787